MKAGATVIGKAPVGTPSLTDNQAQFKALVVELWGDKSEDRAVGKGRILQVGSVADGLKQAKLSPDFTFKRFAAQNQVLFVHRRSADTDFYFVDSRSDQAQRFSARFRVMGKLSELWHADTGKIEPASYTGADGMTTVPLALEPFGTVFVVFREPTNQTSEMLPEVRETEPYQLEGSWDVLFEEGRSAPASVRFDKLSSWSKNSDAGIKYLSGHGTYTKHIQVSESYFKNAELVWIDLGDVANLAEITVNGKPLGIVWKARYRVNVTDALKAGDNTLQVRVADHLWVNRLIGDAQPGAMQYTLTVRDPYKANFPRVPSGLLGPVRLLREEPGAILKAGE